MGDDWAVDYQALAPYYAENDRMTGVAGLPVERAGGVCMSGWEPIAGASIVALLWNDCMR